MSDSEESAPNYLEQPAEYDFANCKTRLDKFGPYQKGDVLAAIIHSGGNLAKMAMLLGRNRNKVRDYVLANTDVKDVFDEVREARLDLIEETAYNMALQQDGAMVRFMLQCLAKDRGYTTRVETSGPNGGPLEVEDVTLRDAEDFTSRIAGIAARRTEASRTSEADAGDQSQS